MGVVRASLLSTYYENAGDDLIRAGVQQQLRSVLGYEPRWRHVSKANPLSLVMPLSRWSHAPVARMPQKERDRAKRMWRFLKATRVDRFDKIGSAPAFVVAGTPLFYFVGEHDFIDIEADYGGDWPHEILSRLETRESPRFCALGVGSIYEGDPAVLLAHHPAAAAFMRRFVERASLVTTRDAATDRLVRAACPASGDRIVRSICPSFWAQERLGGPPIDARGRVAISFSLESVGWDQTASRERLVQQRVDAFEWVVAYFRKRKYAVTLLAHNQYDVESIRKLADLWGLRSPAVIDARGLVQAAAGSELVVSWRVHGAIAALAAGRPALLFKTDSRWQTAAELGARIVDDRELMQTELNESLDRLCEDAGRDVAHRWAAVEAFRAAELDKLRDRILQALN